MFCSLAAMAKQFTVYSLQFAKRALLPFLMVIFGISANAQAPDFRNWKNDPACIKWVDSVYNTLDTNERIGQFFMLDAHPVGKDYNMDSVLELVKQGKAGGVIFFKGTPNLEADWTNKIQDSAKVQCMIAIDGEWGLAMRLDSTIAFPKQMTLGAIDDNKLIYDMGREIGRECKRMGIQIDFAPVVDVNSNPDNPIINERSFGEDKLKVALKGLEYMQGLQDEGVLACAKHFPGHGDTDKDSHLTLPTVNKSAGAIDSLELYPFKIMFNNGVGGTMVAHLNVPSLDPDSNSVASLSPKIATGLLKQKLGFDGLVFSDALNMRGVSGSYTPGQADSMAFMAGDDILVYSGDVNEGINKIKTAIDCGDVTMNEVEDRVKKVLAYKYKLGLNKHQHVNMENLLNDLNPVYAQQLKQKLFEKAITIAANTDNKLPFKNWNYKKVASLSIATRGESPFQHYINNFAAMDFYYQPQEHSEKGFNRLMDMLAGYDLVIIDLHGMSRQAAKDYNITDEERKFIEALSGKTKVLLAVFGNPYSLHFFDYMPWVMEAYEDDSIAQLAAANALFGAEKVTGRLPVTASKTYLGEKGFMSDTVYRLKISWPEEVGMSTGALEQMDKIVQRGIESKAYPGCQLLVAKDGKVIWDKCYGTPVYEIQEPVKPGNLYDLASITKVAATTLAVMKLYSEKKIALDKTVGDYLELPEDATIGKLKIHDVLTHQAGLKPFFAFYAATIDSNFDKYYRHTAQPGFTVQVADSLFIRDDYPDTMWHIMACSEINPHPKYVYSDCDFYIMQKIVEKVSGKKLDDYVMDNFYKPMGLTRIGFHPLQRFRRDEIMPTEYDTIFRKQVVQGYVHDPGSAMYGGVAGHAGLFSNAFDLAAVFEMLLNHGMYNGKQILDSATIKLFTSRQSKISRRGLGFDKPEPDVNKPSPCYDGVPLSVFGHTGFTGTSVWSDPDNHLTFVFLSNRVYPNAENNRIIKMNIRTDLQGVVYKALPK
ncbi:MAG TPA: glycoside hydrolase family 3 N-terminal domain-containing protein [Chitinophagales bacterium]|nr:glycoside hydrolase family 3 N-terminal domain-containing protein [Chitinophagales bacterium]